MRGMLIGAFAFAALLTGGALGAEPTGTWLSQSGETKVRIAPLRAGILRHDRLGQGRYEGRAQPRSGAARPLAHRDLR